MKKKTCAACDCELDANPIKVKIRGKTVEVCCADCATKLKEAAASAKRDSVLRVLGLGADVLLLVRSKAIG